ncbi:esterase/lipase family protein [Pseudomonas turukhanskensis]|uniref:Alpha/beta hydrolase n=1 Tax=Pseudomonas turukhanskensis TaxID=1806536 RepID=A0A9W6NGR0_9PSED|nr:alpha/beta hydrolase [Pseudomonas turukhanskensis]GLK90328.1 hypothetical protein GCM10017655_33910 [Pseudomonas turukhanskensis]
MPRSIVIVHGWSDEGKSFTKLAKQITTWFGAPPVQIRIADWISLQNDVTYADLAVAMERAWIASGLSKKPHSVDIVTHSTGALVVREWMTRYYTSDTAPIQRFVMLAPANFGSPLAHKGRSFIGRVLKGWNRFIGQTGTQILKGLELGSPYTMELARRDLFGTSTWYGSGKILATVLVGNVGYDGVEAIANEDGSDGTVRISTANLNASRLTLALDQHQQAKPGWKLERANGAIAFGIVDQENHSTVALKDRGPKNPNTLTLIQAALNVTDADFAPANGSFAWQSKIDQISPFIGSQSPRYQNLAAHVSDDLEHDVLDYFFQLYRQVNSDRKFEKELYEKVITTVHPYEDNGSYRSIYLSISELERVVQKFGLEFMYLSLSAQPLFRPPQQPVGYGSVSASSTDGLAIPAAELKNFFVAHTTLLVEIVIDRQIDASTFTL